LYVAEATGTAEGSKTAFDAVGRGGRVAVVGVTTNPVTQHFLILKGLTVYGNGGGIKFERTIELIAAGKLDLSAAISHRYPFSRLKDALERKRTDPEAMLVAVDVAQWD
jgi:threonine dehydrogenase-like Zn-dependent dehydrogenase